MFHRLTSKECVILQTKLPEILANITRIEEKLHRVLVKSLKTPAANVTTQCLCNDFNKYKITLE